MFVSTAVAVPKRDMQCDKRQALDFANICSSTCSSDSGDDNDDDDNDDDSCPGNTKCCSTECGGSVCMAAVRPTVTAEVKDEHKPCQEAKQQALLSMRIDPTKATVVPFCRDDGSWERVQCNLYLGVCWCVEQDSGHKIAGTQVRGTPDCGVRHDAAGDGNDDSSSQRAPSK